MYVNDRVQHSQSLCVSVRVTAELCWCCVTARTREERARSGERHRDSGVRLQWVGDERARWRWVYRSLRETRRQHCYCGSSVNQRTWLQALCQPASALSQIWAGLQSRFCLTDLVLWCFCWRRTNKLGKFPHGVKKLTQCLEKRCRSAAKIHSCFFGFI